MKEGTDPEWASVPSLFEWQVKAASSARSAFFFSVPLCLRGNHNRKEARMRIALVIPHFDPRRGGAERWTWDFADRLARHAHEVHVVAETFGPGADRTVNHFVPVAGHTGSLRRLGFAAGAERILRGLGADIVHDMGHGWYGDVFMPHGGTRNGSFRQNLLFWPRGLRWAKRASAWLLPRYRTFRALERRQYGERRLFVALSRMVERDMIAFHGVPPEQIRVVYNGVDTERFDPAERKRYRAAVRSELGVQDAVVFLLVAHNFRLKGVPEAIRAAALLAAERRDFRVLVVGNDRPGRYNRLAQRLGCADVVRLVGSRSDTVPVYAAADVYLHPTYYDPCSLVVLEALASGLPVITTRHNGAGELITAGQEGSVADDPADIAGLRDAMRELLASDVRHACGARARVLAERHDMERNYREMIAVYDEAASLGRRLAKIA